jgi:hypothetical protein
MLKLQHVDIRDGVGVLRFKIDGVIVVARIREKIQKQKIKKL